jgi:hypothetical protein
MKKKSKKIKLVLALRAKMKRIRPPHRAARWTFVSLAALRLTFCYRVQLRKTGSCEEFRGLRNVP